MFLVAIEMVIIQKKNKEDSDNKIIDNVGHSYTGDNLRNRLIKFLSID